MAPFSFIDGKRKHSSFELHASFNMFAPSLYEAQGVILGLMHAVGATLEAHLGRLRRGEVKPGRNKVMLRHLGPVSPFSGARHQTSWPGSDHNKQTNKLGEPPQLKTSHQYDT